MTFMSISGNLAFYLTNLILDAGIKELKQTAQMLPLWVSYGCLLGVFGSNFPVF